MLLNRRARRHTLPPAERAVTLLQPRTATRNVRLEFGMNSTSGSGYCSTNGRYALFQEASSANSIRTLWLSIQNPSLSTCTILPEWSRFPWDIRNRTGLSCRSFLFNMMARIICHDVKPTGLLRRSPQPEGRLTAIQRLAVCRLRLECESGRTTE